MTEPFTPPPGSEPLKEDGNTLPASVVPGHNPTDYAAISEESVRQITQAAEIAGTPPWEKVREIGYAPDVIDVFVRVDAISGYKCVFGKSRLSFPPETVYGVVSNYANWKSWDPFLLVSEQERLDDRLTLIHLVVSGVCWPIWNREVIYLETKTILEDGTRMLTGRSCEHARFRADPTQNVTSFLHGGGWHIKPVGSGESEVTYYMHLDPKLSIIPQWIIDLATVRFPSIINKVRASCSAPAPSSPSGPSPTAQSPK